MRVGQTTTRLALYTTEREPEPRANGEDGRQRWFTLMISGRTIFFGYIFRKLALWLIRLTRWVVDFFFFYMHYFIFGGFNN